MHNNETVVIRNRAALRQLLSTKPIGIRPKHGEVLLELQALSPAEIELWQAKIDSLYFDCGCSVGSIVLLASMGCYVSYLFIYDSAIQNTLTKVLVGVLVFFASAAFGKCLGLCLAQYRLRNVLRQLETRLTSCENENMETSEKE